MADMITTPAQSAVVDTFRFDAGGNIPNNPKLPAVRMRAVVATDAGAAAIRTLMEAHGWGGTWTWTVYDFHHYHSNAHETLIVASGWARLVIGGPQGRILRVEAGDALVLPAGTGHCRVEASPDFQVCGGYPRGQETCDTIRSSQPLTPDIARRIGAVPLPEADPVYGADGPLPDIWRRSD